LFDTNTIAIYVDPLAFDVMHDAFGKQDQKRTIWVHHIFSVGNTHGHLTPIAFCDRLQLRGSFETSAPFDANRESQTHPDGLEVDDATRRVRTFIVFEAALPPETLVAATNRRSRLVDAAAILATLMQTIIACALVELVDAQHGATKRAGSARPRCRAKFALPGITTPTQIRHDGSGAAAVRP
jgi:hypothetical protein